MKYILNYRKIYKAVLTEKLQQKMKANKLFGLFGIFAVLVLSLSFASAALNLAGSFSAAGNQTQTVSLGTLTLSNGESAQNVTNLAVSLSNTTLGTLGGNCSGITVNAGGASQFCSLTLTIPSIKAGTYSTTLVVSGTYNNGTAVSGSSTPSVSITVNPQPGLKVEQVSPITSNQNGSIKVTNTGNTDLNSIYLNSSDGSIFFPLGANTYTISSLPYGANSGSITVSTNSSIGILGRSPVTIYAASSGITASTSFSIEGSYCSNGNVGGNLTISLIEDNSVGDAWEWKPAKTVKVRVKVDNAEENIGGKKRDVTVKLGLFPTSGSTSDALNDVNEDDVEKEIKIDEGDTGTFEFEFQVPADIDDGNYKLYAKAYSGESTQCTSEVAEVDGTSKTVEIIEITKDEQDVVVSDVSYTTPVTCGSSQAITAKVYNIGTEDQDRIRVTLLSPELGIKMRQEFNNLDAGDSQTIDFLVNIPANASETTYTLRISSEFEYDSDDDTYGEVSDEDQEAKFQVKLMGNCLNATASPTISASIVTTEPRVGEEMEVTVTFLNNGAASTYAMSLAGYESWAKDVSIDPSTASIASGASQTFTLKLTPTVSGVQNFTVRAIANGQIIEQPMQVTIGEKAGFLDSLRKTISEITGTEDNTVFYIIVGILVILIILIIVLIVKALSRSKRSKRKQREEDEDEDED